MVMILIKMKGNVQDEPDVDENIIYENKLRLCKVLSESWEEEEKKIEFNNDNDIYDITNKKDEENINDKYDFRRIFGASENTRNPTNSARSQQKNNTRSQYCYYDYGTHREYDNYRYQYKDCDTSNRTIPNINIRPNQTETANNRYSNTFYGRNKNVER